MFLPDGTSYVSGATDYDENGNGSKVINHDKEGYVSLVTEYTYNQYGYITGTVIYDGEGNLVSTSECVYS